MMMLAMMVVMFMLVVVVMLLVGIGTIGQEGGAANKDWSSDGDS